VKYLASDISKFHLLKHILLEASYFKMNGHIFRKNSKGLNVVSIGGGNGLSTLLSGLKKYVNADENEQFCIDKLSGIVAVSDDGGSSGRLRSELKMLAPGDIRSCMVALSEDSHLLSKLFQHRFKGDGELSGHSFGNLFLAALTQITGDFAEAVKLSSEILASKGHIYPATNANVHLVAELNDGTQILGETNLSKFGTTIKNIKLLPEDCHPLPEALEAIRTADIITLGPGSLFTSLLPPLLVKGVSKVIGNSNSIKIFICNLMTQPGETEGFTARKHLEIVKQYAPEISFDYIIVNNCKVNHTQAKRYAEEGSDQIGLHGSLTPETIDGAEILFGNLLELGKKVRHRSDKLAEMVLSCAISRERNAELTKIEKTASAT
jgi:uncharacterized cofD-like protein